MEKVISMWFDLTYRKLMLERERKNTFEVEVELENCRQYLLFLIGGKYDEQYGDSEDTGNKGG